MAGLQASLSVWAPRELSWKAIAGRPLAFTRSKLDEAFARAIPKSSSEADGRSRASKQIFFSSFRRLHSERIFQRHEGRERAEPGLRAIRDML